MKAKELNTALATARKGNILKEYDIVVVGGGIAGLCFALNVSPSKRLALLTKGIFGESNTRYAQGGIAAAIGTDDSPDLHYEDTLKAGAGLCDPAAVRLLVDEAPAGIDWLIRVGTNFDKHDDKLVLGMEGAHSRRRILHAHGDATGAEIERALVAKVRATANIDVFEGTFALDLLLDKDGQEVRGILAREDNQENLTSFVAPRIVLANGGIGQLWRTTSNPSGATGDGLAMAYRAGADLENLEFMQFHPTVLYAPGAPTFLISEAVRGEGAYLRNARGERFMPSYDPQAELAPRDVVARAILSEMKRCDAPSVFLDLSHLNADLVATRFPTIGQACRAAGLDLATDLIPVAPAAHYYMGGIRVDDAGRTNLRGLYALGEVSSTGVHGANRLASNSLLEGLVWGLRAAAQVTRDLLALEEKTTLITGDLYLPEANLLTLVPDGQLSWTNVRYELREVMAGEVSLYRTGSGLAQAAQQVRELTKMLDASDDAGAWETRNLLTIASLVIAAGARREESRGAHYRLDFPQSTPELSTAKYTFNVTEQPVGLEDQLCITR